jgi:hypothetical protein
MSATLLLNHEGWEVVTAAWSAAAKPGDKVQVCYQWGADRLSWFDSATGIARVGLNLSMAEFLRLVQRGGVTDLRPYC